MLTTSINESSIAWDICVTVGLLISIGTKIIGTSYLGKEPLANARKPTRHQSEFEKRFIIKSSFSYTYWDLKCYNFSRKKEGGRKVKSKEMREIALRQVNDIERYVSRSE